MRYAYTFHAQRSGDSDIMLSVNHPGEHPDEFMILINHVVEIFHFPLFQQLQSTGPQSNSPGALEVTRQRLRNAAGDASCLPRT